MLILTIFSQKSAIFKNFPLLKVKNMGKVFHNFFADWGNNKLFGRIFTYAKGSIGCVRALSKKNDVDWNCGGSLGENYSIAFTLIEKNHSCDFRMMEVLINIPGHSAFKGPVQF